MTFRDLDPVSVGGLTKAELLWKLGIQGVSLNEYAMVLFADELFTTSPKEESVRLTVVSLTDLGLPDGGTYQQIIDRGQAAGLVECRLEVAPHLRLSYLDQVEGPYLTVTSRKLRDEELFPNGLYLRRLEDGLWLRGYNAGAEIVYQPDFTEFVFARP